MSTKILSNDIQLRASERMADADDSGGEMSATIIADNAINQLFSPISESDRVTGRVSLREAYLHINTASADVYRGANVIIDKSPTDPNVEVLLFDIGIQGGLRSEAKSYVEQYISIGPRSRMHPVGTQNAGQGQILAYQRIGAPIPEIGDVYVIQNEITGISQAIKIKAVESYPNTYSYVKNTDIVDWDAIELLLSITQPLTFTFSGSDPSPLFSGDTWIRRSIVSDSAKFYGITKLQSEAVALSNSLLVSDIQKQLLPNTVFETSIVDAPMGSVLTTVDAGSHEVSVLNYAHTHQIAITLANRGFNYSAFLRPVPSDSTLTVSFRSNERWYELRANSDGDISGDATEYGSGKLSNTGTVTVTLGVEPDVGSSIIFAWGSAVHYRQQLTAGLSPPRMALELGVAIVPNTLTIAYKQAGVDKLATTTADGNIVGPGVTGFVWSTFGSIALEWTLLPDMSTAVTCNYDVPVNYTEELYNANWAGVSGNLTPAPVLTHTPVNPGTLTLSYVINASAYMLDPAPPVPPRMLWTKA